MKAKKISAKEKLQHKQNLVKSRATQPKSFSEEEARVNELALVYEVALGIYKNRPTLKFLKGMVKKEDHNYKTWLRAVTFADELGVDFTTYVTAQFYYFDKWFARAPKVMEIASHKSTTNAKERVKLYLVEVATSATKSVVGPVSQTELAMAQDYYDFESEQNLKTLMKNFNKSAEEVLRLLARPETRDIYFNRNWLKKNDTYKKLQEMGEV